jgi:hypothetical protein
MNGKTAKLIRRVASTNPYETKNFDDETRYVYHTNRSTWLLAPGRRLTIKILKKLYKNGFLTTQTLRDELNAPTAK